MKVKKLAPVSYEKACEEAGFYSWDDRQVGAGPPGGFDITYYYWSNGRDLFELGTKYWADIKGTYGERTKFYIPRPDLRMEFSTLAMRRNRKKKKVLSGKQVKQKNLKDAIHKLVEQKNDLKVAVKQLNRDIDDLTKLIKSDHEWMARASDMLTPKQLSKVNLPHL